MVATSDHVHLAEQQIASQQSGGSVRLFAEWGPLEREHSLCELHAYLQSLVLRPHYWSVVMKMRVSAGGVFYGILCAGVGVESYCGCVTLNEDGDPIAAMCDAEFSLEVCLDLPKYLAEPVVYAQMAVLYPDGLIDGLMG